MEVDDLMEEHTKAAYFDSQVDSSWASPAYTPEEILKLEQMLSVAGIRKGMAVLEPGCGTGRLTEILADKVGTSGNITSMDISPAMVEAARKRLEGRSNVTLACSHLEDLVPDRKFDLVICHQVFPHFDHKALALDRMASSLKPSGRLVIYHLMGSAVINNRHRKANPAVAHDKLPDRDEMARLFNATGMVINILLDDDAGYLLVADRPSL
jgi:demethylmenaquinone methyltransferase/2-methoxy-6-polyprenyl-1,4-benzoquinol methylase